MNEIRFIHISDLHIGRKSQEELLYGKVNSDDVLVSLRKTVSNAKRNNVDLIFITGDLFDEPATKENLEILDEIFSPLKNTAIIYCQGERDYLKKDGALTTYEFSSNIYVAGCDKYRNNIDCDSYIFGQRDERATAMVDIIRFDKMGVCIYVAGYYSPVIKMHILDGLTPYDNETVNFLLGYGGTKCGIPINYPELRKSGFDYAGLGGEHNNKLMYNGKICYPGSLEPLSSDETGHHGYIEGCVKEKKISCSFRIASKKEYKTIDYPISNYMSNEELSDELKRIMINEGKKNIFRINLVRQTKCEKTFDVQEELSDFNISAIDGQRFVRKDYDEYTRANRGNEFSSLLKQIYGETPVKEDGAKLAVDSVIEESGICYRHNKKLSDKMYELAVTKVIDKLNEKREGLIGSDDVREYENARRMLNDSQDVLDELNKAWADERKAELTLKTAKNNREQILPRHRRKWIKTGFRTAVFPLIIFVVLGILFIPYIYMNMIRHMTKLDVVIFLIMGISIIVLCFFMGYFFSKTFDMNKPVAFGSSRSRKSMGYKEELLQVDKMIEEYEARVDELKKIRRNYQTIDNRRREIISDINIRESNVEKVYYEIRLMEEAVKLLSDSIETI